MKRLSKLDAIGLLQEHGALLSGHFRLPSGLHSQTFVQTALVSQYPHLAQKLAKAMDQLFPTEVDCVIIVAGNDFNDEGEFISPGGTEISFERTNGNDEYRSPCPFSLGTSTVIAGTASGFGSPDAAALS